jgi:hypothetical protein
MVQRKRLIHICGDMVHHSSLLAGYFLSGAWVRVPTIAVQSMQTFIYCTLTSPHFHLISKGGVAGEKFYIGV